MTQFVLRPSPNDAQVEREVKALGEAAKKICKTPATTRAFLVKHGFIKKKGGLTKRYGG